MAAAALLALRIGNTRKPAPLVMVSAEAAPEPCPIRARSSTERNRTTVPEE